MTLCVVVHENKWQGMDGTLLGDPGAFAITLVLVSCDDGRYSTLLNEEVKLETLIVQLWLWRRCRYNICFIKQEKIRSCRDTSGHGGRIDDLGGICIDSIIY